MPPTTMDVRSGTSRTTSGAPTGTPTSFAWAPVTVRSIANAGDVLELLGPAVRTLRDTSPADPICIHWQYVAGELRLDVFSAVDGEEKAMGFARAKGERVIRRFADDAGVRVSYVGPGGPGYERARKAWCLHEMILLHPHLSVIE